MSDIAIRVEHLGKEYQIGAPKERYRTLRDSVAAFAKSPFRRLQTPTSRIWALKDVSFEIKQGEAVGIIGRNGAGKSTLLKVLSRVTEPTEGRVALRGRVASLLEVGTGFHPELTGRENIFLNGAILGMTKAEIKSKFDEIVDFAEIERFSDTPVKHYSSGMYMRLAFAIAAHLEPEILLVDEVLAVGDLQFQEKCLGKMNSVARGGRTVLFVSHNMAAIQQLCPKSILLTNGSVARAEHTGGVIEEYARAVINSTHPDLSDRKDRGGNGAVRFREIVFLDENGSNTHFLLNGRPFTVVMLYENISAEDLTSVRVDAAFFGHNGTKIVQFGNEFTSGLFPSVACDNRRFTMQVDDLPVVSGKYYINVACFVNGYLSDWVQQALFFEIVDGNYFRSGKVPEKGEGCVLINHRFFLDNREG
jgi:lipopolysaccharide transport system ATP-binding protein